MRKMEVGEKGGDRRENWKLRRKVEIEEKVGDRGDRR